MLSKNALRILEKRYYLKDQKGNLIEKRPEDLFRRVSKFVSSAEAKYNHDDGDEMEEAFFKSMLNQEFMPASPVLFNAGTEHPMLSSCFAIEVEDSIESILKVLTDSAIIFKRGGGVGWNFSKLRGRGSPLKSGGESSGVCSFISLYDQMIETIKQGGRRRGAGAVILDATHPDITEFIYSKRDKVWKNINISVICSDDFMSKIDSDYKDVWEEIVKSNWMSGDPNLIFIDTMNRYNTLPKYPINCVNPCHEICMSSYESCNLAGVNLDKCLKGKKENSKIDWDKLGYLIKMGHRFLDDMIDVCEYPLPEIRDFALRTRRQGLYVFGLAPMLIKLGLRYGSQESLDLLDNLFCFINRVSLESCIELGRIRGNFPDFSDSVYNKRYKYMRCSHRLTIAPSGTTSRISDSYFSIEPYYAFDYVSNIMDEKIEDKFEIENEYKNLYPEAIVTAHDLTPEEHLRIMSVIQKWIDQSISKTVNIPFSTSQDDLSKIFKLSYKLGLKCISVFRDGCKDSQVFQKRAPNAKKPRLEINKDLLRDLYVNKEYSITQISELLDVSPGIVFMRLKENDIEMRPQFGSHRHRYIPDRETMKILHDKGLSLQDIADIFGYEQDWISDLLKDESFGHIIERSIPLSPLFLEFIEGELLGDGGVYKLGGNSSNSKMAYYSHTSKHKEYLEWLDLIFSSEGLRRSGKIQEESFPQEERDGYVFSESVGYYYSSIACVELMEIRNRWYPEGVKAVPEDLELTPTRVRQWYIGDGSLGTNGVDFLVEGFDLKSRNILLEKMKRLGFSCSLQKDGFSNLHISKKDVEKFFDFINRSVFVEVPDCYFYKFKLNGDVIECKNGTCEL